ncbi:N-acetylmuramoyl-L-alanine amidase [Clostridium sp. 1001271B_151109_B4]|uniref:N-acetylmuramoyl-L-alanine amidase n=1 Tax=Clostridium sp. 1001271B_151109_B4 TaxID=2787148 RepID=UPI0018A884BA|nr:N-acetylmuramoyl-L-alanine amidase [Clostridium sp. 1001271B_151109_B4]
MSNLNFGVNDGHTISGPGSGAVGRIKEGEHTRKVGNEVRRLLKERGNTVYNCTVDYASTTNESLALVVQQANRQELDWFIAIHFNAAGGRGVEVYTYEGRQYQDAIDVCNNISSVLGIPNRGVKGGTGLYVIKRTKAKSMLIEVCFVDSDDADKYLSVGHEAVAKAIVEALDEHISNSIQQSINNDTSNESNINQWVWELQSECNKQGFSNQKVDGYPGPKTLAGCPVLKRGSKGNITKLVQEKLISLGYDLEKFGADGAFGDETYEAVVNFQKANGLEPDGVIGKKTWECLIYR